MIRVTALSLLLLVGCAKPKYKLDEIVMYNVPEFFMLVCSGKGKIVDYNYTQASLTYKIYSPDPGCPTLTIPESDIIGALHERK